MEYPSIMCSKIISCMETATVFKPSKLFSNRSLKLIRLPSLRSKAKSSIPSPSLLITPKNSTKEEQLHQVFRHFDSDGDGKISNEELRSYFTSIGESMSQGEVERVIKDFDADGDNLLEFGEFMKLMEGNDDVDDDLRRAFEIYSVDKGSGCIIPRGLQQMFKRLGDVISYEECVATIRVFDLDDNGVLDFNEFQQMMACPQLCNFIPF